MSTFAHDVAGTPPEAWAAHPRAASLPAASLTTQGGDPASRLLVVAAHPDDETLGAGGLIAVAHEAGLAVEVVVLTDGEASHPQSPTHTPAQLAARRRYEAAEALGLLAPTARLAHAGLPDGGLVDVEEEVTARLVSAIGDGRHTVVAATWRRDGHPDHEAAGRAARVAATRTGATLWEYPVWFWHWGDPHDAPWADLVAVPLDEEHRARKRSAVAAHRSQVEPLSDRPGDEVLLPPGVLAHFDGPRELFVCEAAAGPMAGAGAEAGDDRALDDLHRGGEEPWGAAERWYEQRKRQLLLASLPAAEVGRGLEVGCSTGVLAADLAGRCRELVAVDSSPAALATAAGRLEGLGHVHLERHDVPWSWPGGAFDLVVLSEVGYFLSPVALDRLVERVRDCLTPDGVVVLAHWRHPTVGWPLDGPTVHERFRRAGVRPEIARYRDRDVEILVLADPQQAPDPAT